MPPKQLRSLEPSEDVSNKRICGPSGDSHTAKSYACDHCERSFKNRSSLERHKREKLGKAATFRCEHCDRIFQRPEGVRNHINNNRCSSWRCTPALQRPSPLSGESEAAASSSSDTSPFASHRNSSSVVDIPRTLNDINTDVACHAPLEDLSRDPPSCPNVRILHDGFPLVKLRPQLGTV